MAELSRRVTVSYDFNQLYLYDAERERWEEGNEYLDALAAAKETGLTVGARSGVVDVLMPRRENFGAILAIQVLPSPPAVRGDADHIVEFDLALHSGRLVLEGSGGSGTTEVELRPGSYRARLSGEQFDPARSWGYEDSGNPSDAYTLELWPSTSPAPPTEVLRWAGYGETGG